MAYMKRIISSTSNFWGRKIIKREGENFFEWLISRRAEATLINFIYKEPITKKNEGILTREERLAGLQYKPRIIRTQQIDYVRFKITKKKERKKRAAERLQLKLEKRNLGRLKENKKFVKWWESIQPVKQEAVQLETKKMLPRKVRALNAARQKYGTVKRSVVRPLSAFKKNETEYYPTHFTFNTLIGQNVHIGHRANLLDPRSLILLGGRRNGLYIINLLKTVRGMKTGLHALADTVSKRGKILFSNVDKRVLITISNSTKKFCMRYSIINKKLPGILTNFFLTRRHSISLSRSRQLPMFVLALTQYDQHVAVEADFLKIPSIAIFDSNANPFAHAFYSVAGNDESVMTKAFYLKLIFRALRFGHQLFILKWLKNRNRFFDYFFSVFYHRIYRLTPHRYKLERIKKAFYMTSFYKTFCSEFGDEKKAAVTSLDSEINFSNKVFKDIIFKKNVTLMDDTEFTLSNFIFNYFARKKLFLFLFKDREVFDLSPIFHFNLLNFSSYPSNLFFVDQFLSDSALVSSHSILNSRMDGFSNYLDKDSYQRWYGIMPMFYNLIKRDGFNFEFNNFQLTKFQFLKVYCFSQFFLHNARMDRFGWNERSSKLTKQIVYKFLNFMSFRKQVYDKKFAQYKSLVVNKFVLKPNIYMYRKKRMLFLMDELENK